MSTATQTADDAIRTAAERDAARKEKLRSTIEPHRVGKGFDPKRFQAGYGEDVAPTEVHESLRRTRYEYVTGTPLPPLNQIGTELRNIVAVTKPDDPIHVIARQALTTGDVLAYQALLDMLQDDGVLTEEQALECRYAAALWEAGAAGAEIDTLLGQWSKRRAPSMMRMAMLRGFEIVREPKRLWVRINKC